MMLNISTASAPDLPVPVAEQCGERLCWEESEMHRLFQRIATHRLTARDESCMIGYAWQPDYFDEIEIVGWASVWEWRVGDEVRIQVQGYVARELRGCGIASAIVACVCHHMPKTELPICVFSHEFLRIAARRGWRATQYKSVDDGWIAVASVEGRDSGRGDDAGRVHDAAPEVRGVPLARDEKGQAP